MMTDRKLTAANDNRHHRFRGGLPPCIAKLAKVDPEGAWSVLEFGKTFDAQLAVDPGGHDDDERAGSDTADFGMDCRHETKPSILQMLADVLRPRVVRHIDGTITRHAGPDDVQFDGDVALLGSMVFHLRHGMRRAPAGGNLFSYQDANGKTQAAQVVAEKPKQARQSSIATAHLWAPRVVEGAAAKRQQPDRSVRYLDLGGTPMPPSMPAPYACDGRPPLKEQRPDMPFHTACRFGYYAPAVAKGAHWLGGVIKGKPAAQMPAPMPDRPAVPDDVAVILEMALARATYEQIGIERGYGGGYADRAGKRAFLSAVEAIKAIFPAPKRAPGWEEHLAKLRGEPEAIAA
ncbi:hypothetical protein [Aquamicrobium soli]|uniref:Uncharacterized protein n=1 Tax=Aquamicrobium soli TaxID=1811518 RepID=A0ABV7KD26_9HYPH